MSNIVKFLASILGALTLFGCVSSSSDNEDAPSEGKIHPANWMEIHKVDALADLDSCRNCHGFNLDGGSVGLSCLVCHPGAPADFSDFHDLEKVLMAPSCSECHVATGATVDPTDDKVHNSCTVTCHDANYQLVSPPPALAPLHNAAGGDCTACHDAYFDNHIHGTGSNHDVLRRTTDLSNGAACNTCHGMFVNDWTGILALHTDDCAVCHSSTRTTNVGGGFSSVKNVIAVGVTVACLDCHADKTIAHGTDHFGLGYVTGVANCTSCHGNGTDIDSNYITLVHLTCGKCHVNPGGGGPLHDYSASGGTISDNVDYSAFAGGGSCATCHVRYDTDFAAGHQVEDHSGITTSPTCITTCHTAASAALIISTTHNNTCTSCHVNPVTDGSLKAGANGTAASHTLGTPSTCVDCHENGVTYIYGTNFNSHDKLTLHSGIGTTVGCVAAGCHNTAIDGPTTVTQTHNDTCSTCHTNISADGTLKVGVGGRGDASGHVNGPPPSTCESCHTDHFAEWYFHNLDHTPSGFSYVLVNSDTSTNTANCISCHTGDVITAVHDRAATGGTTSCQKCHDAAGVLIGSATGKNGGGECITCHVAYFDGHTHGTGANHDVLMRGTDKSGGAACNTCHRRGGTTSANSLFDNSWSVAPNAADGILALHQGSCIICHNSARTTDMSVYASVQDAILNGITVSCLNCHASRVNAHNVNHSVGRVTGAAKCTSCHGDGTISDGNYIVNIHGALGCGTCHVNAAGSGPLHDHSGTGGTINDFVNYETINGGAGGSCLTCHARYDTNFETGHQNESHVELTTAPSCTTTCHTGIILTTVHKNTCTTCHTNPVTDGTLIVGANANGTAADHIIGVASSCTDCHGGNGAIDYLYDTDFTTHDVQDHTGITTSLSCATTCHTSATAALIISTTHNNTCTNCHNNTTNDGTLILGLNGNGDATGGAGDCASCHATYDTNYKVHDVADHSGVIANATPVGKRDDCTATCHVVVPPATIVSSTHLNSCTKCHSTATDGTLVVGANGYGDASGHSLAVASDCDACHAAAGYFDTHTHGVGETHNVTMAATDKSNGALCNTCHRRGGTGSGNPLFTNLWSGADAIYALHTSTCTICHDSTRATNMGGGYASVQDALTTATTVECLHCHSDRAVSHGGHTDPDTIIIPDATVTCSAVGCHPTASNSDPIAGIHQVPAVNTCGLCHVDVNGGGPLIAVLEGDPTANNGGICTDCHNTTLTMPNLGDFHGLTPTETERVGLAAATHDQLGRALGEAANYTGKLAGAYGGLKVATYDCGDCHSATPDTKVFTSLEILRLHMPDTPSVAGTGYGDCVTCHSFPAVAGIITAGIGGALQNCEACHTAAINANKGPSGEEMYQYDGVRHHKTKHAQAGDCTWCHADPRPLVTTQATAYAATADLTGTYQTGWSDDEGIAEPAGIPTQPACRLCHTNNVTHSVSVDADQGIDGINTIPDDLHGYNINGLATGFSTAGLVVYANNYDNTILNNSYPNGSGNNGIRGPSQVSQSAIHNVALNNGTAKISVFDYGSCLACHSVQLFHAAPISVSDYIGAGANQMTLPYDTLRYAPGRSVFNLFRGLPGTEKGKNTETWKQHRQPIRYNNDTWDGLRGRVLMDNNLVPGSRGPSDIVADCQVFCDEYTLNVTTFAVPGLGTINNFENLTTIPTDGSLNPQASIVFSDPPALNVGDGIHITLATFTAATTTVNVEAYSDNGIGQTIIFTYDGVGCDNQPMPMVGNSNKYTGSCDIGAPLTAGSKVEVKNITGTEDLSKRKRLIKQL